MRKGKRRGTGSMAMTLLTLGWMLMTMAPVQAGEARAHFRAVLRIDAGLVRRDLARRQGLTVATAAPVPAASIRNTPRTLPRAGGGICVRRWIARNRFRWQCR